MILSDFLNEFIYLYIYFSSNFFYYFFYFIIFLSLYNMMLLLAFFSKRYYGLPSPVARWDPQSNETYNINRKDLLKIT